MNKTLKGISALALAALLTACGSNTGKNGKPLDTYDKGTIAIAVDESLRPVIEAEINAYQGTYPNAHIQAHYVSEGEAVSLLMKDSVSLAVITRDLTEEETQVIKGQKITPKAVKVAVDAVSLITHKSNPDTLLTKAQVGQLLTGKARRWADLGLRGPKDSLKLVFDKSSSSNVSLMSRYFGIPEEQLARNVFAANSNEEVITYIQKHPDAIGFIGVNWISDTEDSVTRAFSKSVRVLAIADTNKPGPDDYYQPYQAVLALKRYPFRRDVKIISRSARFGLANGFSNYVANQEGQLVILKAGLLPATPPIRVMNLGNKELE